MKTFYDKDGNALGTFLEQGDASGSGGSAPMSIEVEISDTSLSTNKVMLLLDEDFYPTQNYIELYDSDNENTYILHIAETGYEEVKGIPTYKYTYTSNVVNGKYWKLYFEIVTRGSTNITIEEIDISEEIDGNSNIYVCDFFENSNSKVLTNEEKEEFIANITNPAIITKFSRVFGNQKEYENVTMTYYEVQAGEDIGSGVYTCYWNAPDGEWNKIILDEYSGKIHSNYVPSGEEEE